MAQRPIGSKDFRDLEANAKALDEAVNGGGATFKDRLGRSRLTFAGVMSKATGLAGNLETLSAQVSTARDQAQTAASNAVAVVTGGTASLEPEAGKIPIAGGDSRFPSSWVGHKSGSVKDRFDREDATVFDVRNYGFTGTNPDADTAAVKACVADAFSKTITPTVGSNKLLKAGIRFPAGEFSLRREALLPQTQTTRAVGLHFYCEAGIARIHFADTGGYLLYNNNAGLFVTFERMSFSSSSPDLSFCYSTANGGAQDYYFYRCDWQGTWKTLFDLEGVNNNSEWGWDKCSITCTVDKMLWTKDSDQFLNFWFNQCKLWLYGNSRCVYAEKGGHFKFTDCDWSGIQPTEERFLFTLLGTTHARGVCNFQIKGGRFEMKSALARVMYCEWEQGIIDINADFGSQASPTAVGVNVEHFRFVKPNNATLSVFFRACTLMGYHTFTHGTNSWAGLATVRYENCEVAGRTNLTGLIRKTASANPAGGWVVTVDDAAILNLTATEKPVGSVLYQPLLSPAGRNRRSISLNSRTTGQNLINGAALSIIFPEESETVLVGARFYCPPGTFTSSRIPVWELRDGAGALIYSLTGRMSDGYNVTADFVHYLTAANSTVTWTDAGAEKANAANVRFICELYYL